MTEVWAQERRWEYFHAQRRNDIETFLGHPRCNRRSPLDSNGVEL